jgi:23S rRNA pseudouridine955/2504/2580 synthase/23S rRNA pseudouridine1911/1915/1917 synthase
VTLPKRRWIVDEEEVALSVLLERMDREEGNALSEGRVFVDGQRARDDRVVERGAVVELYGGRDAAGEVRILAEHGAWIATYKPALLATEPDQRGARVTVLTEAARILRCSAHELHAVSRLDVGVSGVVLLVRRTAKSRIEMPRAHLRRYVAIARSAPDPVRGAWTAPIADRRGPRAAETRYATLRSLTAAGYSLLPARTALQATLLVLEPVTGRTHQLRIHAAGAGAALLGDRVHGGSARLLGPDGSVVELTRIALHALAVDVTPARGERFHAVAPVPSELLELWRRFGGDDGDWARAEHEKLA